MSNIDVVLVELDVFPGVDQVYEASCYAQDIVTDYVRGIDRDASVTIEDGSVHLQANSDSETLYQNAQTVFEEAFAEKIVEIQDHIA